MPTTSMSRATALRLDRIGIRIRIPSRLPPRHRASPWGGGEARLSGFALSNTGGSHETKARGLGHESIARVAVSQAPAPAQSEDLKSTGRKDEDAASGKDRDRKRLPRSMMSQRQGGGGARLQKKKRNEKKDGQRSIKTQDPRKTRPSHVQSPNNQRRPQQQEERPRSRSKTRITWARVHQTIKSSSPSSSSIKGASKGASGDGPEPDSRELVTRLRGMHRQWGHLRHQYPPSELLDHRRRFSSWKTKFHNIMAGRHSGPYLWRDKGRWLFELDDISAMRRAWGGLTTEERQRDWPLVMLSTLFSRPARAEMVLEATLDPLPPGYAVLDVLTFVARRLLLEDIKEFRQRRLKAEQTFDLLARILEHMPPGHMPLWQRMLGLFARKLPRDLASELYVVAQRLGLPLHPNTLLQFASRLAGHMAHKQQAFEILQGLAERGVDLNGPVPQSAITSLLHCRPDHEGWTDETAAAFSPRRVLESLMERGFSPNHINATAFLDSLCQRADVDEAIRLALLFAESGVQLDAKAWATIFRGAKHSLRADVVARGFDVAKAASAPYVDVLNNALHAVYYFADAESREAPGARAPWVLPLFEPMLYLYAQRFELGPLQQWLPDSLPLVITQPEGFEEKFEGGGRRRAWRFLQTVVPAVNRFFYAHKAARRLQPSTTTLALMLRAYVRTLRQPYDLMAFYAFFKARLEEPGAPGARLIRDQGSLIHDTIIMTMTERRGLSRPALQVFGDMLRQQQQQQQQRSASSSPSSAPSPHPAPSLCTFSILVRGLIARGDRLLAEQVIQVMREQGIEPDLVAWNTLVKGYAVMQDMGKTVQALQDMEAAGFRPDLFTFRAFGRLKDQGRALEMMEAIIRHNSQTMAADDWSS